jgi:Putative transposase
MTLSGEEFLRRFLLHVLPVRFVRIRYYGLLANRHRQKALELCRKVLPGPPARKVQKIDWRDRLQSLTDAAVHSSISIFLRSAVEPRDCVSSRVAAV